MDANQKLDDCKRKSRLLAAVGGFLIAVLLMVLGGWGFVPAVVVGVLVFVVGGILLNRINCQPAPAAQPATVPQKVAENPKDEAKAPESTAPAKVKKPSPAPAMPTAKVTPSKPLPGQADLAARKGEWKYESGMAAPKPVKKSKPKGPAKTETALASAGDRPDSLSAPRDGGADDLKMIKGVGPKLEALLHSMGFFHFDQIAGWSNNEVAWVDQNLQGFKGRVSRDTWVDQAKILAAGGTTEFSSKVKKGGVY